MQTHPIPANGEKPCDCCLRFHRKLFLVDGYWMGGTCADHYTFYMRESDITSSYWRGYEKQHAKVKRMVTGRAA
jgi:hypothetical protein